MAMLNNQMVRSLFFFKQALWDAQHMRKGWWKGERKDWAKCPKVPVIEENVVCGCLISGLFWSPKVVRIIICCFGLTFASELIKFMNIMINLASRQLTFCPIKKQWSPWKLQSFGFFLGMNHCYPNHAQQFALKTCIHHQWFQYLGAACGPWRGSPKMGIP